MEEDAEEAVRAKIIERWRKNRETLAKSSDITHCYGWPELYMIIVHDRTFGDFPATNSVYTLYIYGSGQPYILLIRTTPSRRSSCTQERVRSTNENTPPCKRAWWCVDAMNSGETR
jgi:hypothetical protein